MSAVNFSEGTRLQVVEAIALAAADFCCLLDIHSDADHNRSVVTLAGSADDLIEGIAAASEVAIRSIDITAHKGVHPRLGAIDVIPFTPAPGNGSTVNQAGEAAWSCAARLWEDLGIPCFLYEQASPKALTLPELRAGAFDRLMPDIGSSAHPTAGAAAVGARDQLVAYNINLDCQQVQLARTIATALRRDASLPYLRTLGLPLKSRGVVQISCNLLKPAETTIPHVFDAVATHCRNLDVEILESELVGLAPAVAFGGLSPADLRVNRQPVFLEDALGAVAQSFS